MKTCEVWSVRKAKHFAALMGYRQIGKAHGFDPCIFLGGSNPSTPAINSRSLMDRHRTSNARYVGSSPIGSIKF